MQFGRPRKRDSQAPLSEFLGSDKTQSMKETQKLSEAMGGGCTKAAMLDLGLQRVKQQLARDGAPTPKVITAIEKKVATEAHRF